MATERTSPRERIDAGIGPDPIPPAFGYGRGVAADLRASLQAVLPIDIPPLEVFELPSTDNREKALPIRPGDLTRLLLAHDSLDDHEREGLAKLCLRLGSLFHHEFYARLRDLKESYAPLDPDSDYADLPGHTRKASDTLDEEFLGLFESAVERANYRPLRAEVIREAVEAPNELGLTYVPNFAMFEHLEVFARGYTQITRTTRSYRTKFRKRTVVLDAYQRLIVVLKFQTGLKTLGSHVRSEVLYLRMFKDVPHVDMEMHLPEQGTKVKMRWLDKAQIASPLLVGLPTLAAKLFLAAVLSPALLLTALFAPISAGLNSFFGFQRAKNKHLSHMIRNLYYLTLANNSSVLTRLVDSAEEEEYKETLLAYFFLWKRKHPERGLGPGQLDERIEGFLLRKTGSELNFEIDDAMAKLERFGLATIGPNGKALATPIDQAVANLERIWEEAFRPPHPEEEQSRDGDSRSG